MKLNRRGRLVFGGIPALILALWLLIEVSRSLWWVGFGSPTAEVFGYCWGSMVECFDA